MLKILKSITLAALSIAASFTLYHHYTWVDTCTSLYGQGRVYDSRTTQRCSMVWEGMTYRENLILSSHSK